MRKKLGLFVLGLLGVLSLFFLHSWYKDSRRRNEVARQALGVIRQEMAESTALASLGDIDIDPAEITLKKLKLKVKDAMERHIAERLRAAPSH